MANIQERGRDVLLARGGAVMHHIGNVALSPASVAGSRLMGPGEPATSIPLQHGVARFRHLLPPASLPHLAEHAGIQVQQGAALTAECVLQLLIVVLRLGQRPLLAAA